MLVPRPIREQAVIPHAVEAAREHMQEDAPDELRRGQGHGLLTRCVGTAVVGVAEPDLNARFYCFLSVLSTVLSCPH